MTFSKELRAAMDTTDPLAYIERVKRVVANQIARIDPVASVKDTLYFNHSSIPDFVIDWPGQRRERRMYLRDSYESIAAAHDGRYLKEGDPVLISLEEATPDLLQVLEAVDADSTERMLVTDVDAVGVIGESGDAAASPLARMVRANFVRGARGRIDRPLAEVLVESPGEGRVEPEGVQTIAATISRSFFDESAY